MFSIEEQKYKAMHLKERMNKVRINDITQYLSSEILDNATCDVDLKINDYEGHRERILTYTITMTSYEWYDK